jgi:hypothetical protein
LQVAWSDHGEIDSSGQIIGDNNRNVTQRAAESAPKYRVKKKGKKK